MVKEVRSRGRKWRECWREWRGGGGYVHLMRALGVALKKVNSLIAKCKTIKRLWGVKMDRGSEKREI